MLSHASTIETLVIRLCVLLLVALIAELSLLTLLSLLPLLLISLLCALLRCVARLVGLHRRHRRITTQICIMTLLVSTIIGRMVSIWRNIRLRIRLLIHLGRASVLARNRWLAVGVISRLRIVRGDCIALVIRPVVGRIRALEVGWLILR